MAYKSRMNSLKASTSTDTSKGPVSFITNMGSLGAKVTKLTPSNNPGPMTAPSAQGPTRPGSK